ncbi:MAG: hypothetical protein HWN66_12240 [Candidatus Helarchaeota archaeon]|nr:hypothetical protein [Candidatus Helarchaeota archaeon]
MQSPEVEEFQRIQKELMDEDPIVRGMAAVDLADFASEHPEYKDRSILLLQKAMNDPDYDVVFSAKKSLDLIEGKQVMEPGKRVIGFGYIPEEYREERPEINQKQMILSCVCCIAVIVTIIILMVYII